LSLDSVISLREYIPEGAFSKAKPQVQNPEAASAKQYQIGGFTSISDLEEACNHSNRLVSEASFKELERRKTMPPKVIVDLLQGEDGPQDLDEEIDRASE
jgi:hypothetical protein